MADDFDLFGNPISAGRSEPGRPEHERSKENIIFVMVLLAANYHNKDIAAALGVSVPTLRKHYFHLLKNRTVMLERIRTKLRATQIEQALAGNMTALNGALRTIEALNAEKAQQAMADRAAGRETKAPKLGKKEEQSIAARNVSGVFAPPQGPQRLQ